MFRNLPDPRPRIGKIMEVATAQALHPLRILGSVPDEKAAALFAVDHEVVVRMFG
jgi:hypothetical protein